MKEATSTEEYVVSNVIGQFEWHGIVFHLKQLKPGDRLKGKKLSDVKFKDKEHKEAFYGWVNKQNRLEIREI